MVEKVTKGGNYLKSRRRRPPGKGLKDVEELARL